MRHRVDLDLALAMRLAEAAMREAEMRVQTLLTEILGRWRGWIWRPPAGIEVYLAIATPEAIALLHKRGFRTVQIHDHQSARYLPCNCPISRNP